jgi:hypothetical protein
VSDIIYGVVAGGFVLALWDAARRMFEAKVFNDREIQRIIALEHAQKEQREFVQNLASKLNATQAAQGRPQVRGLR